MKRNNEERTLTRAEMEIMNILWDHQQGMTTHAIIAEYPDPKPAYSTIATFLKILTQKSFLESRKVQGAGKTLAFYPLVSRAQYTKRFMRDVKTNFFGGSFQSLISFFAKEEDLSDEDLNEILMLINKDKKE